MATNVEPETVETVEPELRICSECCEVKFLTEYRRRYKDREVRMHQCRACHVAAEKRQKSGGLCGEKRRAPQDECRRSPQPPGVPGT